MNCKKIKEGLGAFALLIAFFSVFKFTTWYNHSLFQHVETRMPKSCWDLYNPYDIEELETLLFEKDIFISNITTSHCPVNRISNAEFVVVVLERDGEAFDVKLSDLVEKGVLHSWEIPRVHMSNIVLSTQNADCVPILWSDVDSCWQFVGELRYYESQSEMSILMVMWIVFGLVVFMVQCGERNRREKEQKDILPQTKLVAPYLE